MVGRGFSLPQPIRWLRLPLWVAFADWAWKPHAFNLQPFILSNRGAEDSKGLYFLESLARPAAWCLSAES